VPREPYNTFISGDCNDKAYVWKIIKEEVKVVEGVKEEEKKESEEV
jgi:hypothetical protein